MWTVCNYTHFNYAHTDSPNNVRRAQIYHFQGPLQIEEHIKEIRSVSDTVRSTQKVEKHFHAYSITSSCIWDWKQKTFGVLLIKAIVK